MFNPVRQWDWRTKPSQPCRKKNSVVAGQTYKGKQPSVIPLQTDKRPPANQVSLMFLSK